MSQYPGGDCLTQQGKRKIFKDFPGSDLESIFPKGRHQGNQSECLLAIKEFLRIENGPKSDKQFN